MTTLYDKIGGTYSGGRQSDPRIAAAIDYAVAGCDSILNVGAGTGSYEPASRTKVVLLTNDFDVCANFWLFDYFPELLRADRHIFPGIARFEDAFGSLETIAVPIPADCCDGFLGAYWKRPGAYLDPIVRKNISTFSKIGNIDSQLASLESDIVSGAWERRYPALMGLETLDLGYRILISHVAPRGGQTKAHSS